MKRKKVVEETQEDILSGIDLSLVDFGDLGIVADTDNNVGGEEKYKSQLSAILKQFKEAGKNEKALYWDNTDSEYWVAICFQSREQKELFLTKAGWIKYGDKYLDGLYIAKAMGIDIHHMTPPLRKVNIDKKISGIYRGK